MTDIPETLSESCGNRPLDARTRKVYRLWCVLQNPTVCCLLLFVFPFVVGLASPQKSRAVKYLAGDVYYYLVVAQNFLNRGTLSYDGEHVTNGFHPAWQGCVVVITALSDLLGLSKYGLCTLTLLSSMALLICVLLLLAACLRKATGFVPWAFCLLPLGVCGAVGFLGWPWVHFSLWSYADGMESSLVLFAYSCFLYFGFSRKFLESPGNAIGAGCSLALLTLARLDHAFFLIPFSVIVVWRYLFRPSRNTFLYLIAIAIPAVAILAYIIFNLLYAGTLLPVSGAYKSSFPHFSYENLVDIQRSFLNSFMPEYFRFRLIQIFVPAAAATLVLLLIVFSRTFRTTAYWKAIGITAAGILLLASYNTLYVKLIDHGHWYFPVSALFVSLVALLLCCDFLATMRLIPRKNTRIRLLSVIGVILAGLHFAGEGNRSDYFTKVFVASEALNEHYQRPTAKFITYDDGIFAFMTGRHVLGGNRLVLDAEAYHRMTHENALFLEIALERGYDHVMLSENCVAGDLETKLEGRKEGDMLDEEMLAEFGVFIVDYLLYARGTPVDVYIDFIGPAKEVVVLQLEQKDAAQ